jgi:hypothetical protein
MMSITSRGATGNMARNITGPDAIETTTTAIMSRGVTVSIEELRGRSVRIGYRSNCDPASVAHRH